MYDTSVNPSGDRGPRLDTIVATATAPGVSALAVVRLSGPESLPILLRLAPGLDATLPPRQATVAVLRDPNSGAVVDQCVVTAYEAPASFTGEAAVEISCHGGVLVPGMIQEACIALGARLAEPGEFTRRAYLHGKIDLVQAEAILDLTEGVSPALHRAAVHQLERGLSGRIAELREGLVEIEALLMHHLDFPEEDDPPVPIESVVERARAVGEGLEVLLRTGPEGELLRAGALTVLAGRPNSGKSSLFNALIGSERAIVTEIPGTTRDALEAVVSMSGFPFRLVDTAGLREADEPVERMGIEVAHRYVDSADLILLCVAQDTPWGEMEQAFVEVERRCPVVVVRTKADLRDLDGDSSATPADRAEGDVVSLSVVTGEGLDSLRELVPSLVFRGLVEQGTDQPVLTRARQNAAARSARDEIRLFVDALERGIDADVASTHLRSAETALEELLGVIVREEVMDRLFERFCIGK